MKASNLPLYIDGKLVGKVTLEVPDPQRADPGEPRRHTGTFRISKDDWHKMMTQDIMVGEEFPSLAKERDRRWWVVDPAQTVGKPQPVAFDLEAFRNPNLGVPFDSGNEFYVRLGKDTHMRDRLQFVADQMLERIARATGVSMDLLRAPVQFSSARHGMSSLSATAAGLISNRIWRNQLIEQNRVYGARMFERWLLNNLGPSLRVKIARIYNKENENGNPRLIFAASNVPQVRSARQGIAVPALARRIVVPSVGNVPRRPPYRAGGSTPDRGSNRKPRKQ